jgi:hypothetical protein
VKEVAEVWMVLVPFAAFATAFLVGAIGLWLVGKRTKISETMTKSGKAVHVDSPLGTIDVRPEAMLDPRLAEIPLYPGAMPENPGSAESISEVHIWNRTMEEISTSYWTPHSVQQVWEFYRQQLPDWLRNLDQAQGKELIRHETNCVRLVRVSRRGDRTVIETCIKPPEYPHVFESGS